MSKKLVIIGGLGKGGPIDNCITDNQKNFNDYEFEVVGYLNDVELGEINKKKILGGLNKVNELLDNDYYFIFAIHMIGQNYLIKQLYNSLSIPESKLATVVSKRAFISDTASIGAGTVILPFAYLSLNVEIGKSTMVMASTMVGHDTKIGNNCFIGAGSVLGSLVEVSDYCSICLGSTIIEHCKMDSYAVLGAGSTLISNIPSGEVYAGNPAKFIKTLKNE